MTVRSNIRIPVRSNSKLTVSIRGSEHLVNLQVGEALWQGAEDHPGAMVNWCCISEVMVKMRAGVMVYRRILVTGLSSAGQIILDYGEPAPPAINKGKELRPNWSCCAPHLMLEAQSLEPKAQTVSQCWELGVGAGSWGLGAGSWELGAGSWELLPPT